MLEDPSYSSVVRWGDDGDSFVVLEVYVLVVAIPDCNDDADTNCPPRTKSSPNRYYQNTLSIATLQALSDS